LDCVHFLQREKIRTVSEKIKFLFSARGIRLVFWDEQAAADRAAEPKALAQVLSNITPSLPYSITASVADALGGARERPRPILLTGSLHFAGEALAYLRGEPAAFEECAQ